MKAYCIKTKNGKFHIPSIRETQKDIAWDWSLGDGESIVPIKIKERKVKKPTPMITPIITPLIRPMG